MDRATFEAALTREGFEIVTNTMKPDAVNAEHAHGFDARLMVVQASGTQVELASVGPGIGIPSTEVYAESEGAPSDRTILRRSAAGWATAPYPPGAGCLTCRNLRAAKAEGVDYALATGGTVSRYDAARAAWTGEETGAPATLQALWSDGHTLFAVGEQGAVARRDAHVWTLLPTPTKSTLRALWGISAADLRVVGDGGVILHLVGGAFTVESSAATERLRDIWGAGSQDIYAVGALGTIVHYGP